MEIKFAESTNQKPTFKHKGKRGITLLEVLVVTALIAASLGIAIPVLTKSRQDSYSVLSMNNQRQIVIAVTCFSSDNKGKYPPSIATIGREKEHWNWQEPTMLTSYESIGPKFHRSISAYLRSYLKDASIMFCPNAPTKYKYLQMSWDAADEWDNPDTPPPQDPVIGTYCFYWNYLGCLEQKNRIFTGPQIASLSERQSPLLVSDYFGYGHWRNPNAYSSCEKFTGSAAVAPGTWISSDYWSCSKSKSRIRIKLHAGYVDGHVEDYSPSETVPMRVSMSSDGTIPYPRQLGPGIFYLPENALD